MTETTVDTVEAFVRRQMSASLGGRRGMLEAAVPGVAFTVAWLFSKNITTALIAGGLIAVAALLVRMVQRSDLKHVGNAILGLALGWGIVWAIKHAGGSAQHQALAFFVPGVVTSGIQAIVMAISCVVRWPAVGFLLGGATGDPIAWHRDRQVVRLCSQLTWLLLGPLAILVAIEGPLILAGWTGAMNADTAVSTLAIIKLGVGWPLRAVMWGAMIWLLGRNATPHAEATGQSSSSSSG
ncbi:hypothetical protein Back2_02550 [Nocardioides baekrokdamisoli]|uniref:DUF3159 domain-containing protein n=1 Tax=Nocardioides baekrokdamisoli TaxID=1804624 RepID=A0A3G9IXG7_9ACTN|nr:DUF3159 domain-containing protein [Nocardioides baekrokdamisoli]BBH15968.1 hypothetical protein Back2_02550 [Nocardioides baekrokdamisoli]